MKTLNSIILIALSIITFSCDDVFEEDITDDIIQTTYPTSNTQIESNVVSFQWNSLKGADKYRVQVYGSNQLIVLDSLVSTNHFTTSVSPGSYQWRVRGENFAYQSAYTFPIPFSVIETEDLTNQQVVLISPANSFYTNATSLTCSWQEVSVADSYDLQLIDVTHGQSVVYQQSGITSTSVTLNSTALALESEYQWKIRALNSTSQTGYTSRNFFIDRTNPNQPQNNLPATNSIQIINQPISFSWTTLADPGTIQSPVSYIIEFSNDASFATIIQTSASSTTTFSQSFTQSGIYYWRVRIKDEAGNNSANSTSFKFTIN